VIFKRRLANWIQRYSPLRWGLKIGVRLFVPRHLVGAAGVIFNQSGQILLVEHVFRSYYSWGLPGGWVERGESPAEAVRREIQEELGLRVEVEQLLLCELQGNEAQGNTPLSLGLAYYCHLVDDEQTPQKTHQTYEVLSTRWVDPQAIECQLTPLDQKAIVLGRRQFERLRAT
jgi:8-oxo-dGTP diphosphatase